jgi:hypothetical protein
MMKAKALDPAIAHSEMPRRRSTSATEMLHRRFGNPVEWRVWAVFDMALDPSFCMK